jgi:putative hydrolase of the HAD superfamily
VRSSVSKDTLHGIEAVTFDVGGTLIVPHPSVGHIYSRVAAAHAFSRISPAVLNRRFSRAWRGLRSFNHRRAQWSALVDKTFGGLLGLPPSQTFFPQLHKIFAQPSAWRVFEDVLPTLHALRSRGIKLGIISNWDERLRPLLRRLWVVDRFETVTISCEAGAGKPAASIFRTAANELGLEPSRILHVGDSFEMDVAGAQAAGFQALHLRRSKLFVRNQEIRSLSELWTRNRTSG